MKYKYILLTVLTICFFSCKKMVDVSAPQDRIVATQVFTDDNKATSAVTAIYGAMLNGQNAFSNFLSTVCGGLSSDELSRFNPPAPQQELLKNQLTNTNPLVAGIWTSAYQYIYDANAVLEGLKQSSSILPGVKAQLQGECFFIRALCYFYLVNFFGDVPLVLSTDYSANATLARTPISQVYQSMIRDLAQASSLLTAAYPTGEKIRPNLFCAKSLLARVYLFEKNWVDAEAAASVVISSLQYSLKPLNQVFLKNSSEAIWQLAQQSPYVPELLNGIYPVGGPQIILSSSLLQSFETGDQRRAVWVDSTTLSGTKYFFPGKYKASASTYYYMVFRLAEIYLIRAESMAQQNNLVGALADLNIIRARAGLSALPVTLSQNEILLAVEQERKIELFAEWGHRWLDLKRTDRATSLLQPLKPGWQTTDMLYPIPLSEILANPQLVQNPGY